MLSKAADKILDRIVVTREVTNTSEVIREVTRRKGPMATKMKVLGAVAGAGMVLASKNIGLVSVKQLEAEDTKTAGATDDKTAVVIGGGVAGVSSAYQLARRGYRVTLLDKATGPGRECSAVSAGGMQRSNPVINKESWLALIRSWTSQTEYKFFHIQWLRSLTDPYFLRWVTLLSYYSLVEPPSLKQRQEEQFLFTQYSLQCIHDFIQERGIGQVCGINKSGALYARYDPAPLTRSGKSLEPVQRIDRETLLSLDRTIESWPRDAVCGDFETESSAGNSEVFTKTLAKICTEELGVIIKTETEVTGVELQTKGSNLTVKSIKTNKGVFDICEDTEVVVAAGSWTPRLLSKCGFFCPVYPMKGYSVAMDIPPEYSEDRPLDKYIPSRMLIDNKMYISRLGDQVRVTSVGEFSGWDTAPDPQINKAFRMEARAHVRPLGQLFDSTPTRCGLRPYSADGIILLGRVESTTNLSLNVGPGFNGWKICLGAADVLAATLNGEDSTKFSFDVSKLAPGHRVKPSPIWSFVAKIWG